MKLETDRKTVIVKSTVNEIKKVVLSSASIFLLVFVTYKIADKHSYERHMEQDEDIDDILIKMEDNDILSQKIIDLHKDIFKSKPGSWDKFYEANPEMVDHRFVDMPNPDDDE